MTMSGRIVLAVLAPKKLEEYERAEA